MASVPELTSAEGLLGYPPGHQTALGTGPAWQDVHMSVFSLTAEAEQFDMPAVTEPFIAWVTGGRAETHERETGGDWISCQVKPGSLYLTMSGAPYEFRWKRLSAEPFEIVLLLLSRSIFETALQDLYGDKADEWHFQNASGIDDRKLVELLEILRGELNARSASPLFVRSLAQAVAVHLAREYMTFAEPQKTDGSSLPRFKLRLVQDWMRDHMASPFSLAAVAELAGISEAHFNRLFKRAVGLPPSQYQIRLRMETARRLLRETDMNVVDIANQVGYSNPSHFSQIFRKETGFTPSRYRKQA